MDMNRGAHKRILDEIKVIVGRSDKVELPIAVKRFVDAYDNIDEQLAFLDESALSEEDVKTRVAFVAKTYQSVDSKLGFVDHLDRNNLPAKLDYVIRENRQLNESELLLTQVELAIRSGSRRLPKTQIVQRVSLISKSIYEIDKVLRSRGKQTLALDQIHWAISELYDDLADLNQAKSRATKFKNILHDVSLAINNGNTGGKGYEDLPSAVADLAQREEQRRSTITPEKSTESREYSQHHRLEHETHVKELEAEIQVLKEQLETERNSNAERRHIASHIRRDDGPLEVRRNIGSDSSELNLRRDPRARLPKEQLPNQSHDSRDSSLIPLTSTSADTEALVTQLSEAESTIKKLKSDHEIQIEETVREHSSELQKVKDGHSTTKSALEARLGEVEESNVALVKKGEENETLIVELQNQFEKQTTDHQREIGILEDERRKEVDLLKAKHGKEVDALKAEHGIEMEKRNTNHKKTISDLEAQHSVEVEENMLTASRTQEEALKRQGVKYSNWIKDLKDTMALKQSEHEDFVRDMGTKHDAETSEHLKKQGILKDQVSTWRNKHMIDMRRAEDTLQGKLKDLGHKHDAIIVGIRKDHEDAELKTAKAHSDKIRKIKADFAEEKRVLNVEVENLNLQVKRAKISADDAEKRQKEELLRQSQDYEKKLEDQDLENERIANNNRNAHEQDMEKLQQRHSRELATKEQQHAQAIVVADRRHEERRQEVMVLQDRLQKRDNHVGLTDAEILNGKLDADGELEVYGMATILAEVKNFAAWDWRDGRKVWDQDIMYKLAGDRQKRVKKLILGDLIWTILFQNVFETPFRLLGDIGKKLENDWSKNYGKGSPASDTYSWPPATLDSEKFRYDTCQDALKSLTKPTTEFSDDGRLKRSFFNNRKIIRKQLFDGIELLVDLDEEQEAALDEFFTNVALMWLCFGTQHYRLQMTMMTPIESDQEKKMHLALEGKLEFTTAPRLQRYGNARGLEHHEVSVVSGCEGRKELIGS